MKRYAADTRNQISIYRDVVKRRSTRIKIEMKIFSDEDRRDDCAIEMKCAGTAFAGLRDRVSGTREKIHFPGSDEERKRKMSGKNSPKAT